MARWVKDTRRRERMRTVVPAGEVHSQVRVSSPVRRSRTRSWERSRP